MSKKILIVDDDITHLSSTKGILEAEGYEVYTHGQAFGSTNAIAAVKPDLVLLDVNMPGLSGDRLVDVYRATARARATRFVLYSSNDEDSLRETARRLEIDGYVCKGSPAALRTKVAAVLAR